VKFLSQLAHAALDLLLPPRCEVCGTLQEPVICDTCAAQLLPIPTPICQQCGIPLDPRAKTLGHCAECQSEAPPFDAARAAGVYGGVLRRAIHVYKYELVVSLARPLADFLTAHLERPFPLDCLCPVPLHPARERMRGFNQSCRLAEEVSKRWDIPVEPRLLARVQNTRPQMQLPRDERRANVRGAFTVNGEVRGRSIGLVDDVYTTGSTLRECSRMLKHAGAARVLVITLARALPDSPHTARSK
jgi:ComF family protein